jgi:hypothetical protein
MTTPEETLAEANRETAHSLGGGPPLHYFFVAHNLWGSVTQKIKDSQTVHLQFVPEGSNVYDTAGKAGAWLGKNWRKLNYLTIIAHGSPGQFTLGENVTSANIAPLGGWLYSFFEPHAGNDPCIQIIGCNAAADSTAKIGRYTFGQANDLKYQGVSHVGYNLLLELAKASSQKVEGPLHALSQETFRLLMTCRRVFPNGSTELFVAGGVKEPNP